jgi:hypothetical protein
VPGIVTAYDAATGHVLLHDDWNLYSYDLATDRYTRLAGGNKIDYHLSAVIDPVKKKLVLIGGGEAWAYDIGPGSTYVRQTLATTGGSADRPQPVSWDWRSTPYRSGSSPGTAGIPSDSLNLTTSAWTPTTLAGGPARQQNGTYKRWSYAAGVGGVRPRQPMTERLRPAGFGARRRHDARLSPYAANRRAAGTAVTSNTITVAGSTRRRR